MSDSRPLARVCIEAVYDRGLGRDSSFNVRTFIVCVNSRPMSAKPSCAQRGSEALADWLEQQIAARQLDACVERSVCLAFCQIGPNIRPLGEAFVHEASIDKLIPLLEETAQACGDDRSHGDD